MNKWLSSAVSAVLLARLIFIYWSYYFLRRYYLKCEDEMQQEQVNNLLIIKLIQKETIENLAKKLAPNPGFCDHIWTRILFSTL